MDGIHDLGGKQGFGAVVRETAEPLFHARWESRVFGLIRVGGGGASRNIDHFRHAVERIDPVAYLTHGYYGRWLGGLETMIVEAGILEERRSRGAQSNSALAQTIGLRRNRLRTRSRRLRAAEPGNRRRRCCSRALRCW